MIKDEHIQTLTDLGLSILQAKTYLNLAKLRKANVQTIAKASSVARQDIYRIVPTLQKLGLVEKIVANPIMYKATSIEEGLSILLQNRKEEYAELQKKTSSLLNNFHTDNCSVALQEEDSQFKITSEMTLLSKKHEKLTQTAQTSIDITVPLKVVEGVLVHNLQYFKTAMRKGVKIRIITQKVGGESTSGKPQALAKNPLFELKHLSNPDLWGMHIFDRKEMTLCLCEKNGLPSLWSNNDHLVKMAANYFDGLWNKAQKNPN